MWDIVLAAAVGSVASLGAWGLRSVWEARQARLILRQDFVASVIDCDMWAAIDGFDGETFSAQRFYEATAVMPAPGTRLNIKAGGELLKARELMLAQIRNLYAVRIDENKAGQYFSSRFDREVSQFQQRMVRWSLGRSLARRIVRTPGG